MSEHAKAPGGLDDLRAFLRMAYTGDPPHGV